MRPRWQFVLRAVLMTTLAVLLAIIAVFFISLVVFTWRASGTGFLPHFGTRGWILTLSAIPWWVILVALAGSLGLIVVLERTTPSYRRPVIVVFGVVLVIGLAAGTLLAYVGFHERFGQYVEEHNVPIFGPTYHTLRNREADVLTLGTIQKVNGKKLTVLTVNNEKVTVKITDDTDVPPNWTPTVGERIAVIGRRSGSTVTADACRALKNFQPRGWFGPGQAPVPEGFVPVPTGPNWST